MPFLSAAHDRVKPSETIAVTDKARALKTAGRFQRPCFIRHRDGRGRLHAVERSGQERHHRLLASVVILRRADSS